jgi:hypothetical protein
MRLSQLAQMLWAAGFAELVALFIVLLVRRRWKVLPVFTGWIGFQVLREVLLYCVYRYGAPTAYAMTYWSAVVIDLGMQIAIVFELAARVLKPTGTWVRDARKMFLVLAAVGTLVAAAAAYGVNPVMPSTLDDWIEKGLLFAAMLNAQLFLAMALASTRLGLAWRHHVMGIATGWTLWAVVGLFVEAASSYFGTSWHGLVLDQLRIIAYQAATIYWAVNLWLPEPQSRTLSPGMQSYLSGLQRRLKLGVQGVSSLDRRD